MSERRTEVLVVGAGPTGLMAAGGLAHRGIGCRLVDKAPERTRFSRALVVHARTLEVVDLAGPGLADECVRRGYTVPGLSMSSDSRRPAVVRMHRLDTRFPYVLVLPQVETEEILDTHLEEQGVSVEWGTELLGFAERDGWVESRLRLSDGSEDLVRSRYLIGCDGAHSAVRHKPRHKLPGV
jgi:2-polyprenyl-6-methoxyphenol hydroxylase-like FAD-dependent oxidoreductase